LYADANHPSPRRATRRRPAFEPQQEVQCRESLGQRHGAAKGDERNGRREVHRARPVEHGRQRGQAVEPGRLKQEVIVRGDRCEAAVPRGVNGAHETREGLPLLSELHEWQVDAELQSGVILS
jgi:hypothetical protein